MIRVALAAVLAVLIFPSAAHGDEVVGLIPRAPIVAAGDAVAWQNSRGEVFLKRVGEFATTGTGVRASGRIDSTNCVKGSISGSGGFDLSSEAPLAPGTYTAYIDDLDPSTDDRQGRSLPLVVG